MARVDLGAAASLLRYRGRGERDDAFAQTSVRIRRNPLPIPFMRTPMPMMDSAENPTPITPGPLDPNLGTQGAQIARSVRTLLSGMKVSSRSIILAGSRTIPTGLTEQQDGNACAAGLDLVSPDGIDATQNGTVRVFTSHIILLRECPRRRTRLPRRTLEAVR